MTTNSANKNTVSITQLVLPIETLSPNPWNTNHLSPEHEAKLEASIRRFGMFKPIVVRTLDDGRKEILGGQHRWEAAKRMGFERVPVVDLGSVSTKRAKEIGLVDNGRYGADDMIELSTLLKELGSTAELAEFLPYEELDLVSMFGGEGKGEISLDDIEIDADDLPPTPPTAPATHQIMRFSVPVEDVAWIQSLIEATMREQHFTQEDSQSNAGNALVHLLMLLRPGTPGDTPK